MKRILSGAALLAFIASPAFAADYATLVLTTTANVAPEKAWSRIGDYCAIKDWLGLACKITKGDGAVGTMRDLDNGRVVEMMVAKTPSPTPIFSPSIPRTCITAPWRSSQTGPVTAGSSTRSCTTRSRWEPKTPKRPAASSAPTASRRHWQR